MRVSLEKRVSAPVIRPMSKPIYIKLLGLCTFRFGTLRLIVIAVILVIVVTLVTVIVIIIIVLVMLMILILLVIVLIGEIEIHSYEDVI